MLPAKGVQRVCIDPAALSLISFRPEDEVSNLLESIANSANPTFSTGVKK
jgi:hypothetical protein